MADGILVSGSSDQTIRLWDIQTCESLGFIDTKVSIMAIASEIITGDLDGNLKIWNFDDLGIESILSPHANAVTGIVVLNEFILTSSVDGYLCITSLILRQILSKINYKEPIHSLTASESFIITGCNSKLSIRQNPLFSTDLFVLGPHDLINNFYTYIQSFFIKSYGKHNQTMDQFVVLPFFYNMLHIYTFLNLTDYLKSSLEFSSPLIANPISPLCITMYADLKNLKGIICKYICLEGKNNPYLFHLFEEHLTTMNFSGFSGLPEIYESAYISVQRPNLAKTCLLEVPLPLRTAVKYQRIQLKEFLTDADKGEGGSLLFKENYIGIYMVMGSRKSIEFMDSLIKCPNLEVLRTKIIQDMVLYK